MSKNPKIMVLHLKELVYILLLVLFGIILLVLLFFMFFPKNKSNETVVSQVGSEVKVNTNSLYGKGVYSSNVTLGSNTVDNPISFDLAVTVSDQEIEEIALKNESENLEAMYPLIVSSFSVVHDQVLAIQCTDIEIPQEARYSYSLLLDAIDSALEEARAASH